MIGATDDLSLVARARDGSPDAAVELFERHWPAACRVAYAMCGSRATAEDAAQDAFTRAFARLGQFRGDRFEAWLMRIVVNRARDLVRRDRRFLPLARAEEMGRWDEVDLPDRALAAAVRALPADRRDAVVMRYWLDYSPPEIADLLDVPVGTVNSRLARALKELRARLEDPR
ncbi:MAG: RNA polymerase sigma factor [Thermoleophilia bacterium]